MEAKLKNVDKIRAIKAQLAHGSVKEIARMTGFTDSYVSQILDGGYYNEKVIEATITLYKSQQKQMRKIDRKLSNIHID
jgi:hypothetical protein